MVCYYYYCCCCCCCPCLKYYVKTVQIQSKNVEMHKCSQKHKQMFSYQQCICNLQKQLLLI